MAGVGWKKRWWVWSCSRCLIGMQIGKKQWMNDFYPCLQSWVMLTALAVWTDFYEGRTQAAEPMVWMREAGMSQLYELCYAVTDGFYSLISWVSAWPPWCFSAIDSDRWQPRKWCWHLSVPWQWFCCCMHGSGVLLLLQACVSYICDFRKSPLLESCLWGCFVTFPGCGLLVCSKIHCSSSKSWDLKER